MISLSVLRRNIGRSGDYGIMKRQGALYKKLPQDVRAVLQEFGREARNEIAHELTLSIAAEIQTEEGRSTLLASLRRAVAKIADADRIVCVLAHLETRGPLPTVAAFEEFPKRVVEWVCDVA